MSKVRTTIMPLVLALRSQNVQEAHEYRTVGVVCHGNSGERACRGNARVEVAEKIACL